MKYEELKIVRLPKTFDIWDSVDYVQPYSEGMDTDDILFDAYPAECDEDKGEEAIAVFKYNESATGVYIVHNPLVQTLTIWLSPWAVETDVKLFVVLINALLAKHKRAKLFDEYAPLKGLSEEDEKLMNKERKDYLKSLLKRNEYFVMEGLNASFPMKSSYVLNTDSIDILLDATQGSFVKMQWESNEK